MGNTLLPNNPTLDDIKNIVRKINDNAIILNGSIESECLILRTSTITIIENN